MRTLLLSGLVTLLLAGTALVVYLLLPVDLKSEARTLMQASLTGDTRTMYRYCANHERKAGGLTEEKWSRVYNEVVRPRLQPLEVKSIADPWGDSGPSGQAGVDAELIDDRGRVYGWSVQLNSSDHGPATLLMDMVTQTWTIEYIRVHGSAPSDVKSFFQAGLDGLAKDRPLLESIGLTGKVGTDPESPVKTWDELEQYYRNMIASADSEG